MFEVVDELIRTSISHAITGWDIESTLAAPGNNSSVELFSKSD